MSGVGTATDWNLIGLGFQILGILLGFFAVRKLVFRKEGPFDPNIFDNAILQTTTVPDNAPIDEKTKKKVDKITVIDPKTAVSGVISLVFGLILQMIALFIK